MTLLSQMEGTSIERQFVMVKAMADAAIEQQMTPADQLIAIATYLAVLAEESPDPNGLLSLFYQQVQVTRGYSREVIGKHACTQCGKCGKTFDTLGKASEAGNDSIKSRRDFNKVVDQALACGIFSKPRKIRG